MKHQSCLNSVRAGDILHIAQDINRGMCYLDEHTFYKIAEYPVLSINKLRSYPIVQSQALHSPVRVSGEVVKIVKKQ